MMHHISYKLSNALKGSRLLSIKYNEVDRIIPRECEPNIIKKIDLFNVSVLIDKKFKYVCLLEVTDNNVTVEYRRGMNIVKRYDINNPLTFYNVLNYVNKICKAKTGRTKHE